ncbi:MAG: DUF3494 domain-containing protein [Myxococcaceae bacterium]|nr:MAG: DUF3494 domain-containing protein [Myxococcaceae bacterium]
MSERHAPIGRARRHLLLTSMAALLAAGCGTRSILGAVSDPDVLDASMEADAPETSTDVARTDLGRSDAPDVTLPDVPGALDAPDASRPDVSDVPAALDVSDASLPDVSDVPAALDVSDTSLPDVSDVADVRDVALVDTPVDRPDAPDAPMIDAGPMGTGTLGSAARFTILAGSTVSNTGLTTITGEVGVSPGLALVGIPAGTVVHAGDPVAALAQADTTVAYNRLAGLPCGTALTGRDLGGMTLSPGVYCFTSSAQLTGTLVLDGRGQTNPLFVFQVGSTLVTSNISVVLLTNGARSCGVYWQTGSSATVGIGSNFSGNIIALGSVTLTTGVTLQGRALARSGGVTMDTNSVSNAACPDPALP